MLRSKGDLTLPFLWRDAVSMAVRALPACHVLTTNRPSWIRPTSEGEAGNFWPSLAAPPLPGERRRLQFQSDVASLEAMLLEQADAWAIQRAAALALETFFSLSNDPTVWCNNNRNTFS